MPNPWEGVPSIRQERPATEFSSSDLQELRRDYGSKKLPLNIAELVLKDVQTAIHADTWESSAKPSSDIVNVGLKAVPRETATRWGWGVYEAANQIHIKVSHEYAHFVQDFFNQDLEVFLDDLRVRSQGKAGSVRDFFDAGLEGFLEERIGQVKDTSQEYVRLYLWLTKTGRVSGLPEEEFYKKETEKQQMRGSLLDIQTYEDMADTVGAWMLGEKYYNFRLNNSKTPLTPEQKTELTGLIEKIFETWATNKSQERP